MNTRFLGVAPLLFVVGALVAAPVAAQNQPVRPEGSLSFLVGVPQGAFSDNVSDPGFGIDLFAGLGLGQSPVVIGLDLGVLVYGREVRHEPFSNTIPDVRVRVETTNNIFQTHFVLRLQPPRGAVRPFADGLVGVKYLFTQTQIDSEGFNGNDPIASSTNFDDFALSYGVGGGLAFDLYRPTGENQEVRAVVLTVGAQYLLGAEADYLQEGSIRREDGDIAFDVDRSRTTLLEPYLGVGVRF